MILLENPWVASLNERVRYTGALVCVFQLHLRKIIDYLLVSHSSNRFKSMSQNVYGKATGNCLRSSLSLQVKLVTGRITCHRSSCANSRIGRPPTMSPETATSCSFPELTRVDYPNNEWAQNLKPFYKLAPLRLLLNWISKDVRYNIEDNEQKTSL